MGWREVYGVEGDIWREGQYIGWRAVYRMEGIIWGGRRNMG